MTFEEMYRWGKDELRAGGVLEAELDARLLLEHACGIGRSDLLAHGDREADSRAQAAYESLVARRKERIPLQQLTGVQEFMGLEYVVDGQVLIPRQDTEILVEEVLRNLYDGMRVLDLCTGTGCILISLLHYSNDCEGLGTDISKAALAVAERNAERLLGSPEQNAQGRRGRISLRESDLFERVEGTFDIIVSNPPYIPRDVIGTLMPEVRDHEPALALDGGEDGLSFYRRIVPQSMEYLGGGGMLFLEIGYDQAGAVRELMEDAGFLGIEVVKDYAGLDRVVHGRKGFG